MLMPSAGRLALRTRDRFAVRTEVSHGQSNALRAENDGFSCKNLSPVYMGSLASRFGCIAPWTTMAIRNCLMSSVVLVLPFLFPLTPSHAAADRFLSGERFSPQRTITSSSGDFVFGFFNLSDGGGGGSSSLRWYVGIWYANAASLSVAWVANRDAPVSADMLSSTFLAIRNDSSLQLTTNGSTIWSTKSSPKRAAAAVIQNDGNLVLIAVENTSETLWESFEEPVDTWMPYMKLGTHQRMCAWKSLWNPARGPFCLHMSDAGGFLLTWNSSITYWDDGVWNGQRFSKTPDMVPNDLLGYRFGVTGSYKYFVYWYVHPEPGGHQLINTWLNSNGQVQTRSLMSDGQWNPFYMAPVDACDAYAACGAFASCNSQNLVTCSCLPGYRPRYHKAWDSHDWSGGCVRDTPFACVVAGTGASGDEFVKLRGQYLPRAGATQKGSMSLESCRDKCLANCSCTAFAVHGSCLHWFGDILDVRHDANNTDDTSLFLRLNARDVPRSPSSHSTAWKAGLSAGASAVGLSLMAVAGIFVLVLRRRRAKKRNAAVWAQASLKVFSYREMRAATKDFSQYLGGGGFGSVFKGTLADAARTEVAVKKLEGGGQGEKEFYTEVATIGQLQHINVLRLLGFCSQQRHRLLVYEFMPNGSLASHLFGAGAGLDWKTRFGVAVGAARALEYLHERCRERIIHCDIKPENILLDAQFCAKIADFGLAKMLRQDVSRALTSMRGTRGYLAPEWLSGQPITAKADVYSFGMTLLEVVTGRRNVGGGGSNSFSVAQAATNIGAGNAMAVLDPRLAGDESVQEEQVSRVACMAMWCVQEDEGTRPSMRNVLQVLQGVTEPPQVPPPVPVSMQEEAAGAESSVVFFWERQDYDDDDKTDSALDTAV